jgi:hypothetical protein
VNCREFKGPDKHQITSTKIQTRTKQQIPKLKHAEGQSCFRVWSMSALPAPVVQYFDRPRLELGFLAFGPCLLFGACSLVLLNECMFWI